MRTLLSSLAIAGLLSSHVASAACVSPADREALDVAGLKTALMVQTLTCKNDTEYNAFINKFKPELVADEKVANSYFTHQYGRLSQRRHDEYLTGLANSKADASQRDGTRFCQHNESIFSEVMQLRNGAELKQYAAGRATATPAAMTTCTGEEKPTASSRTSRTSRARR